MRLLREVCRAVRGRVGEQYPVIVKLNGTDMLPLRKGATTAELVEVATVLQDDGIDAVEISRGHYEGFIRGQIREGSGARMSRTRRAALLPAAPLIERAAERLAPGTCGIQCPVCGYQNGCIACFGGRAIDCYVEDIRARRDDMLRREENA